MRRSPMLEHTISGANKRWEHLRRCVSHQHYVSLKKKVVLRNKTSYYSYKGYGLDHQQCTPDMFTRD